MNDHSIPELEGRLRSEAERLDAFNAAPFPLVRLHAAYVRARRRRAIRTAAAALIPAVLVGGVWLVLTARSGSEAPLERSIAQPVAPTRTDGTPHRLAPMESGVHGSDAVAAVPRAQAAGTPGPIAIPIVIIRVEGGQELLAPGFFVPAHETPVDIRDLLPIEQRAVRQVLDLDGAPPQAI